MLECVHLLPSDPFMWCGSIPAMAPRGPSEPGPIGNWRGKKTGEAHQRGQSTHARITIHPSLIPNQGHQGKPTSGDRLKCARTCTNKQTDGGHLESPNNLTFMCHGKLRIKPTPESNSEPCCAASSSLKQQLAALNKAAFI